MIAPPEAEPGAGPQGPPAPPATILGANLAARVAAGPVRLAAEELAVLTPWERACVRLTDRVNRGRVKRVLQRVLGAFGRAWVTFCTRNLVRQEGAEGLRDLPADRGLMLVSNHRSYFDMFLLLCCYVNATGRLPNLYCPVRSTFYYDHPLGPLVNAAMSGFAMYPPIFRQPRKKAFNTFSLARMVELLRTPGTVLGFHPEGTRNKGPDPYALLPAQPGTGKLILEARPTVLPAFVNGLENGFFRQIAGNFTGRGRTLLVVWGRPLDLTRFHEMPNRLRTHKLLADHVLDEIRRLGDRERAWRAAIDGAAAR